MMEMTSTILDSLRFSAAWLKGRSRGALICGIFGAVWMFEALYFGRIATPVWLTAVAIFTVAFVAWPVARLRSFPYLPYAATDLQRWAAISKTYWTVVAIEWLACAVAVNWLLHIHRYGLMPQCLGVIIGLHFLPLAKIFKVAIYYATGAVMALGVLASLTIPAGDVRNIVACSVLGLSLWTTAAIILCRDGISSRETEGIRVAADPE
ncbi:MAG: hypothetical protein M3Y72_12165 [Acidobacteriota bacterium]|nr:hypothetical protein [Acidobacteriota bacterium]